MRIVTLLLLLPSLLLALPPAGTFSIVAHDPLTGEVGVAVQSCVFSVGPPVAWARAGVGAVATQAQTNESFGPRGLELMAAGLDPQAALDSLLAKDDARENRQLALIDANGATAAYTGGLCMSWAGDAQGPNFSCQGNILASGQVLLGMIEAFTSNPDEELALRMILALQAAQEAGGDSRGQQSAAIVVGRYHPDHPEYATRYVDLAVEDHETPIDELLRLYRMHEAENLSRAHIRFAELREASGDAEGATFEMNRVGRTLAHTLENQDSDAGTLNALAWYCATADVYLDECLVAAERAVKLEPEDSNILDTLAEVHFRMGNIDEALKVIERALALSPDDAYLNEQRSRFLAGEEK